MSTKRICQIFSLRLLLSLYGTIAALHFAYTQDLKKEVYVISSYRPEIADAEKLGFMPLLPDTFSMGTSANYSLLPSKLKSDFTLRPIKPAKMVGTPLDKLYNSRLKLGLGNYTTPLIEYSIQNLRSKEYAVGAYVSHKSSHKKFELDRGIEVPAGYGRNDLLAYGKRFYKDINLFAEAGANTHNLRHYGLNTAILSDSFNVKTGDIRQTYINLHAKAGLHSTRPDSGSFGYSFMIKGNYFFDHFENKEPQFAISGALYQPIKTFLTGLESSYNKVNFKNTIDTVDQSILTFYPFIQKRREEWQINVGVRLSIFNSTRFDSVYVYPDASMTIRAIPDALYGFFGITGFLEQNTYQNITSENPYIIPGLQTRNTNYAYIIYGGVRGYLSSKISYKISISLESLQDMVFFQNSGDTPLQNQFEIVTDDADRIKYQGEVNWMPLSYLSFYLKTNYYNYKLYALEQPWHRPAFEFLFTTRYNFKKKIYADVGFIALGKRYARDLNSNEIVTLDPVYDINLKLEYRYSNVLSIFLDFYNLTTSEYYLWNQYPVQRLNVIGGISYKF